MFIYVHFHIHTYIHIYTIYIYTDMYFYVSIYICILCFCSHIVTDLHVWANITPEEVLSVEFCFFYTNRHLEFVIWEVLSVCSKILENWGSKCKSVAIVIQFQTHSISGLAFQCSYIIIHVHTCSYIIYQICSKIMKNDCQWFGYTGAQRTSKVGLLLVICGGIWWTVNQSMARYEKRHGLADKHVQTNSPSSSLSSSSSWWWWLWLWSLLLLLWWSLSRSRNNWSTNPLTQWAVKLLSPNSVNPFWAKWLWSSQNMVMVGDYMQLGPESTAVCAQYSEAWGGSPRSRAKNHLAREKGVLGMPIDFAIFVYSLFIRSIWCTTCNNSAMPVP